MNKKTKTEKAKETLKQHCRFGEHRAYVAMAIARKKINPTIKTNGQEYALRKVLKTPKDIEQKLPRLIQETKTEEENFYLYISCNARNTKKAFYNFLQNQINWVKHQSFNDQNIHKKIDSVNKEWISELQRPHNRDDNYFLFDFDKEDSDKPLKELIKELWKKEEVKKIDTYKTPNGAHIVTEPFNHNTINTIKWNEEIELKTDAPLFVTKLE